MFAWILKKIVGSKNHRELRRMMPTVKKINEFETTLQSAPEEALRAKTLEWKDRLSKISDSAKLAEELDAILPEAFGVVKNGARRLCGKIFPQSRRAPFLTTPKASGRIASSSSASFAESEILERRSFHSRVFARRASSGADWRVVSNSLIFLTVGIMRRNSR